MWEALTPYSKAIGAFLTAIVTWAGVVIASEPGAPTAVEWVGLLGAIVTVVTVYLLPNAEKV